MKKKKTILIGYLDTCSYFSSLCSGFRAIGCDAHMIHLGEAISVGWSPNKLPIIPRYYYRAYKRFWSTREYFKISPIRLLATASVIVSQITLLIWMVLKVDAVILKSGETIFNNAFDLKVLQFFKKTIVFFYVGSDSRPPYLTGVAIPNDKLDALYASTQKIYGNLKKVEHLADIVVANPLSAQFHSGSICIAQMIGNTVDAPKLEPGFEYLRSHRKAGHCDTYRVLHAPSSPALKGSDRIREAVAQLKSEGLRIDYVEVTGRPQAEVMVELAKCDVVVDQLYSDSNTGGVLAIEACAFGKPVIVCGYGAEELSRLLPPQAILPTVFRHPDELLANLRSLLTDEALRKFAAQSANSYFENATPGAVARRFLSVIEGRAPQEWYVDTQELRYVEGVCGPSPIVARKVSQYVEKFGISALLLDDKPLLREKLIEFSSTARAHHSDHAASATS